MDKSKKRSSEKQIEFLIDYMIKNKEFASGKFLSIQGKKTQKCMWEKLARDLNELGPRKTTEQWQKVWKNQKLLTRKKNRDIKTEQTKTGNISRFLELSEKDQKILAVIGTTSSEGLGFGEGNISSLNSKVTGDVLCDILKINESSQEENIEIIYESENDSFSNIINEIENDSFSNIINDQEGLIERSPNKKDDSSKYIENGCLIINEMEFKENKKEALPAPNNNKPLKKPLQDKTKTASSHKLENDVIEKLIVANNEGMSKISHALESMAESNNNIANSIIRLTEIIKDKINTF